MPSQTALKDEHELELLIASRFPIIAIETHEEQRALELLKRCASRRNLAVFTWSITGGWKSTSMQAPLTTPLDPPSALRHVAQVRQPGVYVLLDFHPFLGDPLHVRSGAEIEQSVICALYDSRADQCAAGTAQVAAEIARTRPLSIVMAERIAALRAWAADRTVNAD